MQVFCGIATATREGDEPVCAVALVNASGTLLASDSFHDDIRGYARFLDLAHPHTGFPMVTSDPDSLTADLAHTGGHHVVYGDTPYGSGDEIDHAIALARSLATGEITLAGDNHETTTAALRPLLTTLAEAVHARRSAIDTLTSLLRAVFPAALAAWDDPGDPGAVAILTRMPQPGALKTISTGDLATDLATIADPTHVAALAGALTQAIKEIGGGDDSTVAPSISATAEAVAVWDRSIEGLTALLQTRRVNGQRKNTKSTEKPEARPNIPIPNDLPPRSELRSLDPATGVMPVIEQNEALAEQATDSLPAEPVPEPEHDAAGQERAEQPPAEPEPSEAADEESSPAPGGEEGTATVALRPGRARSRSFRRRSGDGGREPYPSVDPAEGERSGEMPILERPGPEPAENRRPEAAEGAPAGRKRSGPKPSPSVESAPSGSEDVLSAANLPFVEDGADDGLMIFSQTRTAWFQRPDEDDETQEWTMPSDEEWRTVAELTETPRQADTTSSGLPKREPQANLLPGAVLAGDPVPVEAADRDPELLAHNTSGYFRGWGRARSGDQNSANATTSARMAQ
ncbi:hypothetical protein [Salininema proteolyticum]|uniref:Uncharacterized protein n=1 Tax=Salininema proteolyticum TaxID=1607685 RepID=A0ABV8U365_9ACTN